MNAFKKCAKPACIFLAIVFPLVSTSYQFASAAMIATQSLLPASPRQETRDGLHQSTARRVIQSAFVVQGIDPREAKLRVESLTDEEIKRIVHRIDDLSAGGGVVTFSLIILAVIAAAFVVFNYTSVTDVFP